MTIITTALLICSVATAQTEPKDVKEETKTVTTKVDNGNEVVKEKVEYSTKEVQDVRLSESDKNKVNQDRVDAPVQVTETVKITSNSPFTESKQQINYTLDGKKSVFTMINDGFVISDPSNSEKTMKAKQSKDNHQFVIEKDGETGIGYFDDNGNFIVQQFDEKTNKLESKTYKLMK